MKLTICLLTKGREKYLEQILGSFESCMQDPSVKFLILDNGAPLLVSQRLQSWQSAHSNSVDIVRYDVNDSRPSVSWQYLQDNSTDWVVFPSDDDEFRPEIMKEWQAALDKNPNLVAFAAAAAIMNEAGNLTGEVLIPSAFRYSSQLERVASAFHEPPFHWPSLFMRVSKLPCEMPNSRFVFDWWVGLHLLIAGDVEVSQSVGVNYRVHGEQESFLAPLRRKYFEAQVWLSDILNSVEFTAWIASLVDSERLELWNRVIERKPIYGDPMFSKSILATLYQELIGSMQSFESSMKIAADFALVNGVLLKDGETKNLIHGMQSLSQSDLGNIRVLASADSCQDVRDASALILGRDTAEIFQLFCKHSHQRIGGIKFDCSKLMPANPSFNSDIVINEITDYCEGRNDFDFTLTSGERTMINILRKWKSRMPRVVRSFLKRLKNSTTSR